MNNIYSTTGEEQFQSKNKKIRIERWEKRKEINKFEEWENPNFILLFSPFLFLFTQFINNNNNNSSILKKKAGKRIEIKGRIKTDEKKEKVKKFLEKILIFLLLFVCFNFSFIQFINNQQLQVIRRRRSNQRRRKRKEATNLHDFLSFAPLLFHSTSSLIFVYNKWLSFLFIIIFCCLFVCLFVNRVLIIS